ncbi:DUF2000 domain-containing protein [Bradyrhizobium sp. DASA03076]|uniref:DUF2000 domain-containing protein n=1 Tax=Bradyrhizobium sp. BLXBL-03 TaxID=3395916 RepID=UPI003F70A8E7
MNAPETRLAIIVDPSLPLGLIANTVATIGIGIGAVERGLGDIELTDVAGRAVKTSAICPVPILQASAKEIVSLLLKALPAPDRAIVVPFPRFARSLHAFADYRARFPQCDLASEPIDGLGLAGAEKWVRSLTGSLKLLR